MVGLVGAVGVGVGEGEEDECQHDELKGGHDRNPSFTAGGPSCCCCCGGGGRCPLIWGLLGEEAQTFVAGRALGLQILCFAGASHWQEIWHRGPFRC